MSRTTVFPIWKTVKLGTGLKTTEDFRNAIKRAGKKIKNFDSNYEKDILDRPVFTTSNTKMKLDLVQVSLDELGFKDGASAKQICERAIQLGLELCPAEVGPQLCLQYNEQPEGEWLIIAMEPIFGSGNKFSLFGVARDDDTIWLSETFGPSNNLFHTGNRFVFVRRK